MYLLICALLGIPLGLAAAAFIGPLLGGAVLLLAGVASAVLLAGTGRL